MRILFFVYRQIVQKIIYPLALLSLIILWMLSTESGLQTTLQLAESFIPGQFKFKTVKGNWWTRIQFQDVRWTYPNFTFSAKTWSFNPNITTLLSNRLYLDNIVLEQAKINLLNPIQLATHPISIKSHATGIEFSPLLGNRTVKVQNPGHVEITIGEHTLKWSSDPKQNTLLNWALSTAPSEKLSIDSQGTLNIENPTRIQGSIAHLEFNFHSRTLGHLIFSNINIQDLNLEELLFAQKLSGSIHANIHHLNAISALFPVVARPAGDINVRLDLNGTLKDPEFILNATLENGKFYLPRERIKINDIHLSITGNLMDTLSLTGGGRAGEGQFKLSGTASPFLDHMPNLLTLKGKNLQLHDTANMFIIASPNLELQYRDHAFFLDGSLHIPKGAIIEREDMGNIVHSRDVVYATPTTTEKSFSTIEFFPNIQLVIDEGFRYIDNKLDMILKGKLQVEKREDGLYAGNGRLTIVEGQYRLDSGIQYIRKGRLLFVTGTLLNDPLLDIKMSPKNSTTQKKESIENNIYVYGTLKNPIIQLFETNQKTFETLAKMGLSSHAAKPEKGRKLESHLLRASPFIEKLQQNIGVEFGFEAKETQQNLDSPLAHTTTVFVISKPLSESFSIQVLTGIRGEHINSARLKYSLNKNFDTVLESGSDGTGADLTFSMESD